MIGWTTDTVTPDASRALHYTLLWGLDGVVLRTVGGERVPFINEGPVRRRLEGDDVPVLAVDPGLFEGRSDDAVVWRNEVEAFGETAAFCRRLGAPRVLVGALAAGAYDEGRSAAALRHLGETAARSGLDLAVRNEAGTGVATGRALGALLDAVAHPAVRADWRPFDALVSGEDPADGLAALRDVACVTVRDESPDGVPATPGEGRVDWDAQWGALPPGWEGDVIVEVHGRPSGPAGLHAASAVISAVRRARRRDRP